MINSSAAGVIQTALASGHIKHVFGALNGILGLLREDLIDLTAETPQVIEALKQTPGAALGSCRHKLGSDRERQDDTMRILDVFKAHAIGYFFYIGGNDSMDTAHKVNRAAADAGYELICMGIPKTIDNDLALTDHCPGYGSVAKYVATCAMEAGKDTEALYTVDTCTILEVMGRNAGWIAAATGLAARSPGEAPHLIYVPEIPFFQEPFVRAVKQVLHELGRVFIVVCEGLSDEQGRYVVADDRQHASDSFGHRQLGGAGDALKKIVEAHVGVKTRVNKLGTNQREAMHFASLTDRDEAYLCGQAAVKHALGGENGRMITLVRQAGEPYRCTTGLADLRDVANAEKTLPRHFINAQGNHITDAMRDYVRPLVQGDVPLTIAEDGLPAYAKLERKLVAKRLPTYDPLCAVCSRQ